MALEYVNKTTFSGAANATLTGINSNDTYLVHFKGIQISNNNTNFAIRFTISGANQSASSYSRFMKRMGAWNDSVSSGATDINMVHFGGTSTYSYPALDGFLHLHHFNTSGYPPMLDGHCASIPYSTVDGGWGHKFGGIYNNTSAFDGIYIFNPSGGTVSGEMILYKIVT